MKNLVKKAKKNQWKAILSSSLIGILILISLMALILHLALPDFNFHESKNTELFVIMIMFPILCSAIAFVFAMFTFNIHLNIIYDDAIKFRKYLNDARTVHNAILIEKSINDGNCEKAEFFLDLYEKRTNHNKELYHYLSGVIDGVFYRNIDTEIKELSYDEWIKDYGKR